MQVAAHNPKENPRRFFVRSGVWLDASPVFPLESCEAGVVALVDGTVEGDFVGEFLSEVGECKDGAVSFAFEGEVLDLVPRHEKELPFERPGGALL